MARVAAAESPTPDRKAQQSKKEGTRTMSKDKPARRKPVMMPTTERTVAGKKQRADGKAELIRLAAEAVAKGNQCKTP